MKLWAIWDVFKLKNSCLTDELGDKLCCVFSSFRIRNGFWAFGQAECCVKSVSSGGYRWWEAICEQYNILKTATLEIFMPSKWCMFFLGGSKLENRY